MKKHLIIIIALVAFISLSFRDTKSEVNYFVQFKIHDVTSSADAILIDQKMRSKTGVKISRTDYLTSTYFCVLKSGSNYSESDFINWFNKLGYEIGCFNKGIQSIDKSISPHILKNCQDEK